MQDIAPWLVSIAAAGYFIGLSAIVHIRWREHRRIFDRIISEREGARSATSTPSTATITTHPHSDGVGGAQGNPPRPPKGRPVPRRPPNGGKEDRGI